MNDQQAILCLSKPSIITTISSTAKTTTTETNGVLATIGICVRLFWQANSTFPALVPTWISEGVLLYGGYRAYEVVQSSGYQHYEGPNSKIALIVVGSWTPSAELVENWKSLEYNVKLITSGDEKQVKEWLGKCDVFLFYGHGNSEWLLIDFNLRHYGGELIFGGEQLDILEEYGRNDSTRLTRGEISKAIGERELDFVCLNACSGFGIGSEGISSGEREQGDLYNYRWAEAFKTEALVGTPGFVYLGAILGFTNQFTEIAVQRRDDGLSTQNIFNIAWNNLYGTATPGDYYIVSQGFYSKTNPGSAPLTYLDPQKN